MGDAAAVGNAAPLFVACDDSGREDERDRRVSCALGHDGCMEAAVEVHIGAVEAADESVTTPSR